MAAPGVTPAEKRAHAAGECVCLSVCEALSAGGQALCEISVHFRVFLTVFYLIWTDEKLVLCFVLSGSRREGISSSREKHE